MTRNAPKPAPGATLSPALRAAIKALAQLAVTRELRRRAETQ